MKVSPGRIVRIDCELRVSGGEVIESSKTSGPVVYKHGAAEIVGGLEAELEGMDVGEEKSGVIPANQAFGTPETQPTMTIPRSEFPGDSKVEVGARFEAKGPRGTPVTLEVLTVEETTISVRAVHPLAGKDLEFRVKVLSVRPPPPPIPESLDDVDVVEADA